LNCTFCGTKLNPYLLKQVSKDNDKLVFEIECLNCRRYNYVNEEFYLNIKKDYEFPITQPINNKMPSEMNVIFCSMNGSAISWIIRELSDYHMEMFGKPIIFTKDNAEISSQIATKDHFPIPKGWNNVYSIDPQLLLDKVDPDGNKYDRIIVVHRPLNVFKNIYKIRMTMQGVGNDFIEKILKKSEDEYNLVYHEIKDPRLYRIDLWDANQYTKAIFNELMDFLNFPRRNRPPVLRTRTLPFEALFEAYSSVWDKDFKLTGMLGRVEGLFQLTNDGILDYIAKYMMDKNMNNIELKNILIIGPGIDKGCHFSENILEAFKEKGYNAELLDLIKLGWHSKENDVYKKRYEYFPNSKALTFTKMIPDLILFDEPAWDFYNDVKIPVFYYHREYERTPTVYYPDRAYFWHQGVINDWEGIRGNPHWCNKVKVKKVIGPAINPKRFNINQPKTIRGVTCLGGRETMLGCLQTKESRATEYLTYSYQEIKEFIKLGFPFIEDNNNGLTDERYRELLPTCESLWFCAPLGQYVSRRILEAMYCKVVVIMRLESEEHRKALQEMGFNANEHYVEIKELKDMVELNKTWKYENYKDMTEKAYNVVINRHLFSHKVDFIVNEYKDYMIKSKVIM